MIRLFVLLASLLLATSAFANPEPVTNTSKNPYKASKVYCNDAILKPSKGENIACYNHDACYSDPQGRSREECDSAYLRDMKMAGMETIGKIKFQTLRVWGKASWDRCRRNDKHQAQN